MSRLRNHTRWLVLKARNRCRGAVMRTLLRDQEGTPSEALFVAGTARSGTTWLAEALDRASPARLMFEPFHSGKIAELDGLPLFPYLEPGARNERLEAYSERVLSGSIRHPWIDSHLRFATAERRLIKEIRANLFLRWLHEIYPEVPIVFLVRHPCAVVLSRMRGGWSATEDLRDMLAQPALCRDYLDEHMETIESAASAEARHALVWCIHNIVPLRQFGGEGLRLVLYEDLVRDTEGEVRSILDEIAPGRTAAVPGGVRGASATAGPQSSIISGDDPVRRWQSDLSRQQIESILQVVAAFGLDALYAESALPNRSAVDRILGSAS